MAMDDTNRMHAVNNYAEGILMATVPYECEGFKRLTELLDQQLLDHYGVTLHDAIHKLYSLARNGQIRIVVKDGVNFCCQPNKYRQAYKMRAGALV